MEGDEPLRTKEREEAALGLTKKGELTIGFLFRGGMKMSAPLAQNKDPCIRSKSSKPSPIPVYFVNNPYILSRIHINHDIKYQL
jgi:hypothetical protein